LPNLSDGKGYSGLRLGGQLWALGVCCQNTRTGMAWDKVDCLKSDMSFGMYVLDYCKDSRAHYLSQETSLLVCRPSPHMMGHTWLQAHN